MAINFKEFIGDIKKGAGKVKRKYKNKVESVMAYPMKESRQARKTTKATIGSIMKGYPSYTVLKDKNLYAKRRKEVAGMLKEGRTKDAVLHIKNLTEKFKKDNPSYKG